MNELMLCYTQLVTYSVELGYKIKNITYIYLFIYDTWDIMWCEKAYHWIINIHCGYIKALKFVYVQNVFDIVFILVICSGFCKTAVL